MELAVGVLTISDRCSRGATVDASGPILEALVRERGWRVAKAAVVPDEAAVIAATLKQWSDEHQLAVILTTGGTGVGPRDVTPEATKPLLDKDLPGLPELMRRDGLEHTPMAVLSRGLAGTRGRTLIVNFPGSPRGARQCFESIHHLIAHIAVIVGGANHDVSTSPA